MTKEQQKKIIEDLQLQNQKYLLTLIQIKTSPNWDGKQIRAHVQSVLTEALSM